METETSPTQNLAEEQASAQSITMEESAKPVISGLEIKTEDTPLETSATKESDSVNLTELSEAVDPSKIVKLESAADMNENNGSGTQEESESADPALAYTKRDHFTSEIFKIEVKNLPKHFGLGVLRKRIQSLELDPVKVKGAGPHTNYVFVTFRNEEGRKKALEVLNGYKWKGCVLSAKYAKASADPGVQKRKDERDDSTSGRKKQKVDEGLPLEDRLRNAVAPFWSVPYEDQLKKKEAEVVSFMQRLAKEIDKQNKEAKIWLTENRELYNNMCCTLENIKQSPVLDDYRNKCEFTIGMNEEGTAKTVGFRLSSYKSGTTCVAPPQNSKIVSKEMSAVVKCLEDYIRESSYDVFKPQTHEGYWKQLTARTSRKGHIMAIVVIHPQTLSEEDIEAEKTKLRDYFCTGAGSSCNVTSLFFQRQADRSNSESQSPELLYGDKHICEQLLDLSFRISPDAFFQTNTLGAEVLYSTIAEWCQVTSNTYLLDVCCGTGTIGLTMAKNVDKVIGIEMSQQAIDDAKYNAQLNDVKNAVYFCGKAEDVLPSQMYSLTGRNVVAVVDPPRPGLHNKVVHAIRKCPYINRLIYVSCNPQGALNNLIDFTRAPSKRLKGVPFRPVKAVPVDMFPHTKHCELLILLERNNNPDN